MKKKTIMIIDDSKDLRELYDFNLREEGFETILCPSAYVAEEQLKKKKPDLILLDLLMPKKTGLEFLTEIRKKKEEKDIPVVILTNVYSKEEIDNSLKDGAIDYVLKFQQTPQEVVEKIKEILK